MGRTLDRIAPHYRGAHGPVEVEIGGIVAVRHEMQTVIKEDLTRARTDRPADHAGAAGHGLRQRGGGPAPAGHRHRRHPRDERGAGADERQTQPGFHHWGSFAEYVALDHADVNLVALPDDMTYATAAALGCRFATAFRAVVQQGRVAAGEWVAVHGCGGVGLSAVMIAAASGARVVAVDVSPRALELARTFGAAECLDATGVSDPAAVVRELTGGGAHLSLDALGSPATCAASVNGLRRRGRHVQVGLLPSPDGTTPVPLARATALELELLGSHGMAAHTYPGMLHLVRAGVLRPDLLVTRTITLDAAPAALAAMDTAPGAGVTVIEPWS
ncbi:zinc-binding dehydrogenase [Streptomyces canarius]